MANLITETILNEVLAKFKEIFSIGPEGNEGRVQLHTGNPGAEGKNNVAGEATKKQFAWTAVAGKAISNKAALQWTAFGAEETIKFVSLWNLTGAFVGYYELAEPVVVPKGGSFEIPINQLVEKIEGV